MSGLTVKVSDSEDFRWGLEFWITYPGHSEKSWTATFWNSLIRGICSSAPRLRKLTDRPSGCDNMNKAENTHNSQSQSRNSGLRELGNRALFPNPDQGTSGTEQCNMVVERINLESDCQDSNPYSKELTSLSLSFLSYDMGIVMSIYFTKFRGSESIQN